MSVFVFEGYSFQAGKARFVYSFEGGQRFAEEVDFAITEKPYDEAVLQKALFLCFLLIGSSYFKTFPTRDVKVIPGQLDQWQVKFFNTVYQEGLSQFAFENQLNRNSLAWFSPSPKLLSSPPVDYQSRGLLSLVSGGKDSLLTATLLQRGQHEFTPWYLSHSESHPAILDQLGQPLVVAKRRIDQQGLELAAKQGGKNGHVPITYIVQSLALVQAILLGKNKILVSIGHEGEEPHASIEDLPVTHQWSKTWSAEQYFTEYVARYISPDIIIGSPLRGFSELKIAELFVNNSWQSFGQGFSSCNVANYAQGADNTQLKWCGQCPKCANSFLLFAPFVTKEELASLFGGQDLFTSAALQETFKGLLGIDGVMKPFECVGEIEELRQAYHMAQAKNEYGQLSFGVPSSNFDYNKRYESQDIAI